MGRTHAAAAGKAEVGAAKKPVRHTIKFFRESGKHGHFSNFWKHKKPLWYNGKSFETAEHVYQYQKYNYGLSPNVREDSAHFANAQLAECIRTQKTPAMAAFLARGGVGGASRWPWGKKLRQVYDTFAKKGVKVYPMWDVVRVDVMREVVELKVKSDLDFAQKLKDTGDAHLEEASPYDDFWGTGKKGDGKNWLGKVLMEARDGI